MLTPKTVALIVVCVFVQTDITHRPATAVEQHLMFPDVPVGVVTVSESDEEATHVFRAQGAISVPADTAVVSLEISKPAAADLSFLNHLPPDVFDALGIYGARLGRAELEQVVRLDSIKALDFTMCEFDDEAFQGLAVLPELSEVRISLSGRDDFANWIARHPKLHTLFCTPHVTVSDLNTVGSHPALASTSVTLDADAQSVIHALAKLPSLNSLAIITSEETDPSAVAKLETLSNLEELRWFYGQVDGDVIRGLSNNSQLQKLTLFNITRGPKFRDAMTSHQHLESLDIVLANNESLDAKQWIPTLLSMPHLLDWPTLRNIDSESLSQLSRCDRIRSLTLVGVTKDVTDEQLQTAFTELRNLQRLDLQHIPVTDTWLASLAFNTNLEYIHLFDTRVTGAGFAALKDLPKLREIHLFYGIFDDLNVPYDLAALTMLHSLEHVDIAGHAFTPAAISPLGDCKSLKSLRLWGGGFSDDSTAKRLATLPNLNRLTLDDNCVITDVGADLLAKNENIQQMNVGGFISLDGAQTLASLPELKSLAVRSSSISKGQKEQFVSENPGIPFVHFSPLRASVVQGKDGLLRKKLPGEDEVQQGEDGLLRRFSKSDDSLRARMDLLEGKAAPKLLENDDDRSNLTELHGKVVLVDFWGTWCGPCRAQIPELLELYAKHHEAGLEIVGVHTSEGADSMESFISKKEIPWPNVVDVSGSVKEAYKVELFPSYFLIDRRGVLRVALVHRLGFEDAIVTLLKEGEKQE